MTEVDLDALADRHREDLAVEWQSLFGSDPSSRISRQLMIHMIGSQRQWNGSGLSKQRFLRRLGKLQKSTIPAQAPRIAHGTRLIRDWHGKRHIVDVTDEGFVWQDQSWGSLSAIAREITGARWSGPRFFGVKGKA